ncbi:endonuclease/exonuclease/phosphatase family protein [Dongia sedimenti]|uniref:Endonuclease/exonuclease/phosphatase family protein n=1 Tax=Dongia sedimenti TaxID=3064282 RepID=A0ABU0YLE4_9PROT|nr:endonuclease/exonuclease/phosphatase family protein [Rhodospirillaceae bacterium R-7]
MTFTLASYNIQYGTGRDGIYDLARAIDAVCAADIVALQEVERNWKRSGMSDQPAEIAAMLPGHFWVYGAPFDVDAGVRDAQGHVVNRRRQFGMMVLSRWPILSSKLHPLPKADAGPAYNLATGVLETVIAAPGGPFRLYNVHLGHLGAGERLEQITWLRRILRAAPEQGGAWTGRDDDAAHWESDGSPPPMPEAAILLGDFNAEPESAEHIALIGHGNGEAPLYDAWAVPGAGSGDGVTFRADPKQGADTDMRIDYCFLSADLANGLRRVWVDGAAAGSDHQPLWVELDPEGAA